MITEGIEMERTECGHDPDLMCADCVEEMAEVTC